MTKVTVVRRKITIMITIIVIIIKQKKKTKIKMEYIAECHHYK